MKMELIPEKATVLLLTVAAMAYHCQTSGAAVIHLEDFGAAGDGKADDGPAVRKAIDAAIKGGPGTKLVFEKKTYRLGPGRGGNGQIRLIGVDGLTIDGNGTSLLLHPQQYHPEYTTAGDSHLHQYARG